MEEMSPEEQAALDAAIDESYADMEAGRMRPADDVIADLRARADDRARLEAALERSLDQARIGDTMSAEETFAWLRNRREAARPGLDRGPRPRRRRQP